MPSTRRLPLLFALLAAAALAPAAAVEPDPQDAAVFSVDLSARGPLPQRPVVRYNNTLPLQVNVTGPADLVPPDEVHLDGQDARGTPLAFSPNPVPLEPGRHTYPVNATYRPPAVGDANLTAHARGPGRASDRWTRGLEVRRDPVQVAVTRVGDAASNWTVPLRVQANTSVLPRERANLTPVVRWAGDPPEAVWNATPRTVTLTPTAAPRDLTFDARYGAGRYQVRVHAGGPRSRGTSAPVLVDVERPDEAGDGADVTAKVPDRPTRLALADDAVNADGKEKYPGQTVITRAVARDPNGIGASQAVVAVHRLRPGQEDALVRNASLPLPDDAWSRRSVRLEDRFAWAPLKDGRYAVTVRLPGTEADPVRRTFRIRDEQADLPAGAVPDATAATPVPPLQGSALVADDNLGGGPDGPPVAELGTLSARLYRYTQELPPPAGVDFPGGNDTLDLTDARSRPSTYNYTTLGDAGRFRVPFEVDLPADPEPGRYHVTLVHSQGGTTRDLGALYFDLEAPPSVADLQVDPVPPGSNLTVAATLSDPNATEAVRLALRGPPENGSRPLLARANVTGFPARLPVPEGHLPGAGMQVTATPILASGREGNPARTGFPVEPRPPSLGVAVGLDGTPAPHEPLRLVPRTVRDVNLTVGVDAAHGRAPDVAAALLDWNGTPVRTGECQPSTGLRPGLRCHLRIPANLTAGEYTLQVRARGPGGTTTWNRTLQAGPWLDLAVPGTLELEPDGNGTLAGTVPVANQGNVPAGTVRVRLQPLRSPDGTTWRPADVSVTLPQEAIEASSDGGPVVLDAAEGPVLAPGQEAVLSVEVPVEPGVPPGRYEGNLTVATTLGGSP